jgi:arylsulfatase A-like enzyme
MRPREPWQQGVPRAILLLVAAALLSWSGCGTAPANEVEPSRTAAPPANVIVIVIDALRADHIGTYGYHRNTTPNLDRFASRSLVFTRTYTATSWTLPAVASLMTSVYPSVHGVYRPPTEADHNTLPREFVTLAESLRSHGFRTASITSQPWISEKTGLTRGFDESRTVSHASAPNEARVLTENLIGWLGQRDDRPFFLYTHYMGPHSPYDVTSEFTGTFTGGAAPPPMIAEFHRLYEFESEARAYRMAADLAQERRLTAEEIEYLAAEYDEKLAYTDRWLGVLLDTLERQGRFDDTLIVVTADHGEAFFEHGTIFHGEHLHEELVRVPLIVRLPGGKRGPARLDEIVELIDLYPTVHELLGLPQPCEIQGKSLLPVVDGGPGDGVAFAECFGFKIVTRGWSSFHDYDDSPGARELYDLVRDPLEWRNLAGRGFDAEARHLKLAETVWTEIHAIRERLRPRNEKIEIDEETREKLESLGYLGG